MNVLLAQIIVLARGRDIEGWMDILVLVVIAGVYGLGALVRAKGKKAEEQAQEQHIRKPQRKPSTGGRGLLEQFIREVKQAAEEAKAGTETRPPVQTAAQKTTHSQAVLQKYAAAKAKQESPVQPIIAPAKPELSKPSTEAHPGLEKLTELGTGVQALPEFSSTAFDLSGKQKAMPDEALDSMYLSEVLADYEDPEELKRAILHYEILGRPLALRNPSADIIGL